MKVIERIERAWEPYARHMPYSDLLRKVHPITGWLHRPGRPPELDLRSINAFNNALMRAGFRVSGDAWPKFPAADVHVYAPREGKFSEPTDEQLRMVVDEAKSRLAAIVSGAVEPSYGEKDILIVKQLRATQELEARERAKRNRMSDAEIRALKKSKEKAAREEAKAAADAKAEADAAELLEAMQTGARREARKSILTAASRRIIEFKSRTVIRDGEVTRDGRYRAG